MNPINVIVIGGNVPEKYSAIPSLLIRLPGEQASSVADISTSSLPDCLLSLRHIFCDHSDIAKLGGTLLVYDHPISAELEPMRQEWAAAIDQKLKELIEDLGNCCIDSWIGAKNIILNGDSIAACPTSDELKDAHKGKPAIVIASGPSASDYFDHIKSIRHGVVIFCADSILRGCIANGIIPDYVCAIERGEHVESLLEGLEKCGARLICSPVLSPKCVAKWDKNCVFWWSADDIYRWISPEKRPVAPGRSAGTMAVSAALLAGCAPLYLVGHDLAERNGKTHAESSEAAASASIKKRDQQAMFGDYAVERCETVANDGSTIATRGMWLLFKGDIEAMIADYGVPVVNVSDGSGARINGTSMGRLPRAMVQIPPPAPLATSGIESPLLLKGEIIETAKSIRDKISEMNVLALDFAEMSNRFAMSKLCDGGNVAFFQYVLRSLYSCMVLRLHLHASNGVDQAASESSVIKTTARTIDGMMWIIIKELSDG